MCNCLNLSDFLCIPVCEHDSEFIDSVCLYIETNDGFLLFGWA